MPTKIAAGTDLPEMTLPAAGGGEVSLGGQRDRWQAVFVYRGLHCPICKTYLGKLEAKLGELAALGADVVAVSGDPKEKAEAFAREVGLSMPLGYDLSVEQMRRLGLYISAPRSEAETDRPFPEPALFVITPEGKVQIVEIANAPFVRPDLDLVVRGLAKAKEGYPIRGTME